MIEQGTSFVDMLDFYLDAEIDDRSNRRIGRLFSSAKFRYSTARLEHIEYAVERKIKKACSTKLLVMDDFRLGGFHQKLAPSSLEIIDK